MPGWQGRSPLIHLACSEAPDGRQWWTLELLAEQMVKLEYYEPLAGKRYLKVTEHRTKKGWALFIQVILEEQYPDAPKVVLVLDNLNTHTPASLYEILPPEQAKALTDRLEIHYTPKHASWLNIAEIELSGLARQGLAHNIATIENAVHKITLTYESGSRSPVP